MTGSIPHFKEEMMMNSSKLYGRKALSLAVSVLALGVSAGAFAASDNLSVTATVIDNCTISTAALAFGNYDPIVANASSTLDGTGTVTITCTSGASALVTLGQGANADTGSTGAAPLRRMTDATNFLSYALYSDSGHTLVWGDDATVDVARTGTGAADPLTVYGQVDAAQNVPAGSYSDTVAATVTF
jgi:spore coat protein U-like protein